MCCAILAAATFRGIVYFALSFLLCDYYLRVATIRGQRLFIEMWYRTPNSVNYPYLVHSLYVSWSQTHLPIVEGRPMK